MAKAWKAGDKAPDFSMPSTDGPISLADFKGKYLVLYFYPKDNTPGCTNEAIDFSAHIDAFNKAGASVVGVSKDSLKKHENFTAKHDLKVILASDADGSVCEDYGTWVEKSMYGRTYMGIARSTFLIGPDGTFTEVWPKVKVKGHAAQVLDRLLH